MADATTIKIHAEHSVAKKADAKAAAKVRAEEATPAPEDNLPGIVRPIPQLGITVRVVTK